MKLLIVILNYNVTELTIDCLRSLAPIIGEVAGARVAVLENGSNDPGAFALLQDAVAREGWGGWVELSSTRPNRGFTGGNNLVIRKALASSNPPEYFLLLNADTLVRKNALGSLVEFMDAHPAAGIGGSRMLHPDGSTGPSPYRFHNPANQFDTALRLGVVSRLLRRWRTVLPPVDQPSCVDWVSGASMILRADMLRQIGLLDEALYTYFDDIDLCLRARRAGWESWCIPDSRVVHLEGASTGVGARIVKRRPAYWFQARRRFFLKNYGALRTAILDAVFLAGLSISRLRRLWGDRDPDPPFFLRDSFRHSVFAAGFKVTVVENPAMRRSGEASPGPALAPPPPSSPG